MEKLTVTEIKDKNVWEKYVLSTEPMSFLQSWNWGKANEYMGFSVFRLGFYSGEKLIGVAQLIEQRAKRGFHFLLPGGPLIDWGNKKLVDFVINELKAFGRTKGAWFIRVRPELIDSEEHRKFFKNLGFTPAPMHLNAENTWILDIGDHLSEQEILLGMRKTTRYLVRKSQTYGFELETTTALNSAEILNKLQTDTSKRHKFVAFSKKIFEGQLTSFGQDGQATIFIGRYKKKAHSAAIIIFYNDTAYYHHSASSDESKQFPIAYFLQWKVILEARRRGLSYYNFWGVSPTEDPKHRFYGVTLFKKGFGGRQVNFLHAHDLPLRPLYLITYLIETIRKHLRRL